jgi:hypothetical protein
VLQIPPRLANLKTPHIDSTLFDHQAKFADGKLAADEIFKDSKYEDHLGNNLNNSKDCFTKP